VLAKLFESLYLKVFVNIVVQRASTIVYIELCSKKDVVEQVQETFETTKVNLSMREFIASYTKESPFSYISLLDTSLEQGAIPSCSKNRLSYYYDLSDSEYKCHDKKWTYYTSKTDLYETEKNYKNLGLDFIFSPFSVLSKFFEDKIDTHMAMYILIQDSYISLCVFDSTVLLFAEHLDMEHTEEDELLSQTINDDDEIDLDMDGEIDLEDVDVLDEMTDLDDFGDIEDLDSLEEIDEFSENKDIEEEFYEVDEVLAESDEEGFNEDYQRFTLIQSSIGHFYNDAKFDSKFIESVYIADSVGVSSDLKRYLEDEMFLSVYIRHMDLSMEVGSLAKMELGI